MPEFSADKVDDLLKRYTEGFPELREEVGSRLPDPLAEVTAAAEPPTALEGASAGPLEGIVTRILRPDQPAPEIAPERIVLFDKGVRPVMRIRDNRVTGEFLGPANESWATKIAAAGEALNAAIPAVGRIELTNSELTWAGTGWLVEETIIATNRHVVELFARSGGDGRFVFRPGLFEGSISSDIDFQEEEDRADQNEHAIEEVLWVGEKDDVAFLRIKQLAGRMPLAAPVALADAVSADAWIAAIGFPARDPTIRDQALVRQIFGDVYEKKRLAPGKIMSVDDVLLRHDCSTLGGNSGSVLVDLATGKAVGLHYGGYLDDSANLAVPAGRLRALLERAKRPRAEAPARPPSPPPPSPAVAAIEGGEAGIVLNLPLEISIRLGIPAVGAGIALSAAATPTLEAAVEAARTMLAGRADVLGVRAGYRFRNGWITDERAIVVTVSEKQPEGEVAAGELLPRDILGFPIDVKTAPLPAQLAALGLDIAVERPARPAGYAEPPGFDDPDSGLALAPVRDRMRAVFHVSPDAGFPRLREFLGRVEGRLTATMYEWEVNHVSDAIEQAMRPRGARLRMVTQKKGVGGRDATEKAVEDMKGRIGRKFEHVYASVIGPSRLILSSYHIKVASRDDEEFWLSSGNWKGSGQPNIDPVGSQETGDGPLADHNREWHAVIAHPGLATLFRRYIDYDFEQAGRFPLPVAEAPPVPEVELFVPAEAIEAAEAPGRVQYFEPLVIDEELDIQPLLTPDRNARGQRVFMAAATDLIERAERSIFVQNQSFKYSGDDNQELTRFLTVLRDKQRGGLDVRIVFRDASDFPRPGDAEDQRELIERLKDFGFDVSRNGLRLQNKCHTKGILVDSRYVMLGSHNLTNGGALFNRDASLLVRSPASVARYFEEIFLFDWENRAHNNGDTPSRRVRRARPGEPTPAGFRRVPLSTLLADA